MVSTLQEFLVLFYNSQKLPDRRTEEPSYQRDGGWQLAN